MFIGVFGREAYFSGEQNNDFYVYLSEPRISRYSDSRQTVITKINK